MNCSPRCCKWINLASKEVVRFPSKYLPWCLPNNNHFWTHDWATEIAPTVVACSTCASVYCPIQCMCCLRSLGLGLGLLGVLPKRAEQRNGFAQIYTHINIHRRIMAENFSDENLPDQLVLGQRRECCCAKKGCNARWGNGFTFNLTFNCRQNKSKSTMNANEILTLWNPTPHLVSIIWI